MTGDSVETAKLVLAAGHSAQGNFSAYAEALVLVTAATPPPLFVGLFSLWGSGKSSMLRMVYDRLRERRQGANHLGRPFGRKRKDQAHLLPIWVSAWECQENATLWSNVVKEIYEQVEKEFTLWRRVHFFISHRLSGWRARIFGLLLFFGIVAALATAMAVLLVIFPGLRPPSNAFEGLATAGLAGLIGTATTVLTVSWRSASTWYKRLAEKDAAGQGMGVNEEVRRDLTQLYKAVTGQGVEEMQESLETAPRPADLRIALFIDDLERVPAERALEILNTTRQVLDKTGFLVAFAALEPRSLSSAIEDEYRERLTATVRPGRLGWDYLERLLDLPVWLRTEPVADLQSSLEAKVQIGSTPDVESNDRALDLLMDKEPVDELEATEFSTASVYVTAAETEMILDQGLPATPRSLKRIVNEIRLAKCLILAGLSNDPHSRDYIPLAIRLIVLAERFPDFLEYAYDRIFFPDAKDEDLLVLVRDYCGHQETAFEGLEPHQSQQRAYELGELVELVAAEPALDCFQIRHLARVVLNIPSPPPPKLELTWSELNQRIGERLSARGIVHEGGVGA
jgi:hypothetical protein